MLLTSFYQDLDRARTSDFSGDIVWIRCYGTFITRTICKHTTRVHDGS